MSIWKKNYKIFANTRVIIFNLLNVYHRYTRVEQVGSNFKGWGSKFWTVKL